MKYILSFILCVFSSNIFGEELLNCRCLTHSREFTISSPNHMNKPYYKKYDLELIKPCPNSDLNILYDNGYIGIRAPEVASIVNRIKLGKLLADTNKYLRYEIKPKIYKDNSEKSKYETTLTGSSFFNKQKKFIYIDYEDKTMIYLNKQTTNTKYEGSLKLQCY